MTAEAAGVDALPDPYEVHPVEGRLDATVALPGSKSLTNRALVAASLADGVSRLDHVLFADDTEAMLGCLAELGVGLRVDRRAERVEVTGNDGRVPAGPRHLDARLSGTTARFVAALALLGPGPYRLDGSEPLRRRPMDGTFEALRALGTRVTELADGGAPAPGHLPVELAGGPATGRTVAVAGDVSSQFLSGLLLAAPCLPAGLRVEITGGLVSRPYVDMTLAVMAGFGARAAWVDEASIEVGAGGYRATTWRVEPDASAASYPLAAAAICGGRVRVEGLTARSTQGDVGFVDVLARMGASITWRADAVEVEGSATLHGIDVDLADLSDTAQTLAAVAVFAEGPTRVRGIGFIRRKETDRIAAVVTELRRCGIEAAETDDGFVVHPGTPHPATVRTYDDHRMAMSFALLGLRAPGIRIADPGCVAKTFPGYWTLLEQLRMAPGETSG